MEFYGGIPIQYCDVCGKNPQEFQASQLRQTYKCPTCGKIVCADCLYKHQACDSRMCGDCLARKNWRQSTRFWEKPSSGYTDDGYTLKVYEHTINTDYCKSCKKGKYWFCIGDRIRYRMEFNLDK
jgi:hypothetical protein